MTDPRRWFRFSLRALFLVVTVLACWLGWQANLVRARVDLRKRLSAGAGWAITAIDYAQIPSGPSAGPNDPAGQIPFLAALDGDEAIAQLGFERGATEEDRARARELFPEAYVSDQ